MEDLAPGLRFYPTEEELVSFYLHHKLDGKKDDLNRVMDRVIPVVDVYEFSPWKLPQYAGEYSQRDTEQWFFFIPRQESVARGGRPRRLTIDGYWKATGSPGYVYTCNNRCIGVKRTMVFYKGRAPTGRKTEWKMNEYKALEGDQELRQEFSLCRVYKKSKCLRSFDRRPIGVEIGQRRCHKKQGDEEGARASTHQNPAMVERGCSPDQSSSSGEHGARASTHQNPAMVERGCSPDQSSSSGEHGARASTHQNPAMVERRFSPDQSSCSGDHGEESIMPMISSGNDTLWDLDQLHNWLYGLDDM